MFHLTLRQLQIFEAVASHSSYSRGAEKLHLTQPAVSMQIKQLEENIGLPLFSQIGKKIQLTDIGEELLHHSRNITQRIRLAEEAIDDFKGLRRGRLNIAIVSTAKYFAPQLLGQFSRVQRGVDLKLAVGNREEVVQKLAAYEIDLAIMGRPPEGIDVIADPFAKHPHVIIAPPDHPLAAKRRIPLARIAEETFIMREPGSGTRINLERLFAEHGLTLKAGMEMSSNETIKQAVIAGMGISFLSLHTVVQELQAQRLHSLNVVGLPIVRNWYVVFRRDKRLSPMALAFKDFLLREAGPMLPRSESALARAVRSA